MTNNSKRRIVEAVESMQNHIMFLLSIGLDVSQDRKVKEWDNVTKKHYDHCLKSYYEQIGKISAYEEIIEELEAFFETEWNFFNQLLSEIE